MRIRTWQAIVFGLASGVVCSLVWTLVLHVTCPPVFHLLPWLCWPVVAVVTAAVVTGLLLFRRRRQRSTRPRLLPRSEPLG